MRYYYCCSQCWGLTGVRVSYVVAVRQGLGLCTGKVSSHIWLLGWNSWGSSTTSISTESPHMVPSLQHGSVKVARLLTWWLRDPEPCVSQRKPGGRCGFFYDIPQKPCSPTSMTFSPLEMSHLRQPLSKGRGNRLYLKGGMSKNLCTLRICGLRICRFNQPRMKIKKKKKNPERLSSSIAFCKEKSRAKDKDVTILAKI